VVATITERIAMIKQESHKFRMKKFNLKMLKELGGGKRNTVFRSQIGLQLGKFGR
jgi:hypothetical protein